MRISPYWLLLLSLPLLLLGCGTDSSPGTGGSSGNGGAGGQGGSGGIIPAPALDCDPLAPTYCAFPYPSDYYTVADSSTVTGRRLALPEKIMPPTRSGQRSTPGAFNEMDGFSPGIAAMTHLPGATVTGCATPDTIADSLLQDSPTVIINADTGERVPHWVDRDEWVVQAKIRIDAGEDKPDFPTLTRSLEELQQEQAMMLRPAIRLEDATRYIVAFRDIVDGEGAPVDPSPGFRELRDEEASEDDIIESRRAHFEEIFSTLENAGVGRDDLQIAWDFTTASRENNTSAMLHIRDDAFEKYPDGVPYTVEVIDDTREGMACRLEITFDMPLYMTGGETGELLNLGDDGLPEQNGTYPYAAAMFVPLSATEEGTPAPLVAVGHGQLGAKEQVFGYSELWANYNLAGFGLDHKGFSSDDVLTVVDSILGDIATFRRIPERMHQGHLNFLMAMRTLSREAEDPDSTLNDTLQNDCGGAELDGSKRYYFGGSQGGILGAVIMALNLDIERGLLAVPGQSYNLLLNRSGNFDEYAGQLYNRYDWNGLHMQMNLALMQGLWDRAEPTGYSNYIRTDLLPGTPAHDVLIQVSKADHQVTNLGAHIMARTIGGVVNLAPLIRPVWGIDEKSGLHTGSAMLEVDFGNDEPPITNIPHWADRFPDPHGRAAELEGLGPALLQFYGTGQIENPCTDASGLNPGPCDEDDLIQP
ncbi:MAG: hypothetical protein WBM48_05035 [Polyangiales bacterium]